MLTQRYPDHQVLSVFKLWFRHLLKTVQIISLDGNRITPVTCQGIYKELLVRNWIFFTWLGIHSSKNMQSTFKTTSLLILLVSATRSESTEFWTGGAAMGCMAISWILLGTRLLASEERDILSTCSKIEAEECCSFPLLVWGGPKSSEPIQSEAVLPGLSR